MNSGKSIIYLLMLLTTAPIARVDAQALQTQGWSDWNAVSSRIFPADKWQQYESPEEAGWSSEQLSKVESIVNEAESAAVMVIYNGAILAQWGQTKRRFKCHSIRKSLLSALYGIAVEKGAIDLDESIGSIGIDDILPLTKIEKTAKVSDLLKSRSGIYHPATYWESTNLPKRGSHKPGTHWRYNNWDFNALGTIYNNKTSSDLFEAFEAQIAIPTRMQDFELRHTYYHLEPEVSRHAAYPFRMSARDLARFGLLFLNEGRWANKQIVPPKWVRESTKTHSTYREGGYGYMWWIARERGQLAELNAYWAWGQGGHFLYVVPGANLVLVHRADTYADEDVNRIYVRQILLEVLKARIGPPATAPKLIGLDNPQSSDPVYILSNEQSAGLTGKYYKDDTVVTVLEAEGRLEIIDPHTGSFYLFPKTPTEFEIEDEQYRIEFELDASGTATSIRIWDRPDEPIEMQRFRNDEN